MVAAPSGWTSARILKKFTTGQAQIIPRNLDGNTMLVNVSPIYQPSGTNIPANLSGTLTVERFCYQFPSTNYWGAPAAGVVIDDSQLNGIGIKCEIYTLSGSATVGKLSGANITVTGTAPSGYDCYGLAGWYSGNSWCVINGVALDPNNASKGTVSVYNIYDGGSRSCSATITAIAWKATYDTSSVYRTRVSAGTSIQAAHINNTNLNFSSDFLKSGGSITSQPRKRTVISLSGSQTSGYTALSAVTRFNTGYKYLLPTLISPGTMEGVNVSTAYTSSPTAYCGQWYFS